MDRRRSSRRRGFVVGVIAVAIPSAIIAHLLQEMAFFVRIPFMVIMAVVAGLLWSIGGVS